MHWDLLHVADYFRGFVESIYDLIDNGVRLRSAKFDIIAPEIDDFLNKCQTIVGMKASNSWWHVTGV